MPPALVVIMWLGGSLFWGSLCKVMAGNRGLNERSAYWLGFMIWFIGLVIVLATKSEQAAPASASSQPVPLPATAPQLSVADEIAKLAALRDAGELSLDEYEAQRSKLLG
jgi:hypothetical protein